MNNYAERLKEFTQSELWNEINELTIAASGAYDDSEEEQMAIALKIDAVEIEMALRTGENQ